MVLIGVALLLLGVALDVGHAVHIIRSATRADHVSPLLLVPVILYWLAALVMESHHPFQITWQRFVVLVSFHLTCQLLLPWLVCRLMGIHQRR